MSAEQTVPSAQEVVGRLERFCDSPLQMFDRGRDIIKSYLERGVEVRAEHLEAMCVAYLMKTDIDPAEVVLVEDHLGMRSDGGIRIVWYYARKDDIPD